MNLSKMEELIQKYTELSKLYCTEECHISLVSPISNEKTQLRTDGIYVQLGTRPWWSYNEYAYEKWYNLFRVFDNKHAIILGSAATPFYNTETKPTYESLLITCPSNIIQTVQEFKNIGMHNFFNINTNTKHFEHDGYHEPIKNSETTIVGHLNLITPIPGGRCACSILRSLTQKSKDLGWVQFALYNDDFTIYYKDDPNIIYDYGSPCRTERDPTNPLREIYHNFPSYFIPFDLSEKNRWGEPLQKWNEYNI